MQGNPKTSKEKQKKPPMKKGGVKDPIGLNGYSPKKEALAVVINSRQIFDTKLVQKAKDTLEDIMNLKEDSVANPLLIKCKLEAVNIVLGHISRALPPELKFSINSPQDIDKASEMLGVAALHGIILPEKAKKLHDLLNDRLYTKQIANSMNAGEEIVLEPEEID